VRIDFRGDEIEVADDDADADHAHNLEVSGRLGDVSALIVSPLAGGFRSPRLAVAARRSPAWPTVASTSTGHLASRAARCACWAADATSDTKAPRHHRRRRTASSESCTAFDRRRRCQQTSSETGV
jgi:hypothetical protein